MNCSRRKNSTTVFLRRALSEVFYELSALMKGVKYDQENTCWRKLRD